MSTWCSTTWVLHVSLFPAAQNCRLKDLSKKIDEAIKSISDECYLLLGRNHNQQWQQHMATMTWVGLRSFLSIGQAMTFRDAFKFYPGVLSKSKMNNSWYATATNHSRLTTGWPAQLTTRGPVLKAGLNRTGNLRNALTILMKMLDRTCGIAMVIGKAQVGDCSWVSLGETNGGPLPLACWHVWRHETAVILELAHHQAA